MHLVDVQPGYLVSIEAHPADVSVSESQSCRTVIQPTLWL
jgi:hypothetical protein